MFKMDELPNQGQALPTSGEEKVEQDSGETEDIEDLISFLAPEKSIQKSCQMFGMGYNRAIFDGWVKQYSACCGAASVAGCINALANIHRKEPNALKHSDVLLVYESLFMDAIDRKAGSFERRLGCFPNTLLPFITSTLSEELKHYFGREIGGKKGVGATKTFVFKALTRLCRKNLVSISPPSSSSAEISSEMMASSKIEYTGNEEKYETRDTVESKHDVEAKCTTSFNRSILDCFVELLQSDGVELLKSPGEEKVDDDDARNGGSMSDEEDCDDLEDVNAVANTVANNSIKSVGEAKNAWSTWRNEFMDIIKNLSGLAKLRASKPSTAAIGNWAVIQGVQRLSEWISFGTLISCRLFMGKRSNPKQKLDVSLSKRDSEEVIKSQWDMLKAHFSNPGTILLFHLKNHYAIIFAWREWSVEESKVGPDNTLVREQVVIRQILTARKGQRPTAWIDFTEARETMLNWVGYKIMAISCSSTDNEGLHSLTIDVPEQVLARRNEMHDLIG